MNKDLNKDGFFSKNGIKSVWSGLMEWVASNGRVFTGCFMFICFVMALVYFMKFFKVF